MEKSGLGKKLRCFVFLLFCVSLLWMDKFLPNAFAQNNIKDSYLSFKIADKASQWRPLLARRQGGDQAAEESDIKELQAMCYLQGYNPAPLLKGVTVYDKNKSFPGYNLFLSSHAPEAILMDMNGMAIHRWRYSPAATPAERQHYANFWVHARILKNGDLLAIVSFIHGGLLKIDKDSNLIWFRSIFCHHDFDIDSNGDIYTLTVKISRSWENLGMKVDSITVLSPNGETKKEISLYDLFKKYPNHEYIDTINKMARSRGASFSKNGRPFYFSPGDVFHSNSIQILDGKWASQNPAFKKGNVLISIRQLGVIICVDPEKEKIVWLMDTVFWNQGQHYAKLLDNGNILLFDNLYRPNLSRVVEVDPATRKVVWDYSGQNGRFFSEISGQCYRLPNGNTLITESENGHSFEVTPDKKIVWEFYNPNQIESRVKLIAVINQMQRIPIDSDLNWLKN